MQGVIKKLSLEGHDTELFSFLDAPEINEIVDHPNMNIPIWTFGEELDGTLTSVNIWNDRTQAKCFTRTPEVKISTTGWKRLPSGHTTNDSLICVNAISLVRYFFVQGYTASLDWRDWILEPADPMLHRLKYLRGIDGGQLRKNPEWAAMKRRFFNWTMQALDRVEDV